MNRNTFIQEQLEGVLVRCGNMSDKATILKVHSFDIVRPGFDLHPEKSTTDNTRWRQGLFVVFKDKNGDLFKWMPKWDEIDTLLQKKDEVEMVNRKICKNVHLCSSGLSGGGVR